MNQPKNLACDTDRKVPYFRATGDIHSMKPPHAKAFSLVELMVVIAVIGVIAAIGLPMIGPIVYSADAVKNRRNAQNIASMYNSAVAAGMTNSANSTLAAVELIAAGVSISPGNGGEALKFSVDGMTADEREAAERLLELRGDQLVLLTEVQP